MDDDKLFDILRRPPIADEVEFGRGKWIYCSKHSWPHTTGWCTVPVSQKKALWAVSAEEARAECAIKGYRVIIF